MKKILSLVVCLCFMTQLASMTVFSEEINQTNIEIATEEKMIEEEILDLSSYSAVNMRTVNDILAQHKFTYPNVGFTFAAERGNNLADKIKGKNTIVVGDNYIKNGADRLIIERDGTKIWIQDKYYADAKSSINACFDETGMFRYIDGDGNPMQIEVPNEQYDEAVEQLRKKINDGKLKNAGITDPNEADTLVRKGALTYKQAKNLAKAGTFESLKYDATNGTVSSVWALGISALLNYSVCRIDGQDMKDAAKVAVEEGLKTGGLVFCSNVIAGQLAKTGVLNVFKPSSEALVKAMGDDFARALIKATGEEVVEAGVETTAKTITKHAAKVLRSQALVAAVEIVVFSVPDAIDLFNGRISKKQFVKNFAVAAVTTVAGAAVGVAGGVVGNLIVPGVGTVPGSIVGGILGGTVGGFAADAIADYITDDDAEEMYVIIQDTFVKNCDDFLVTESEAENVVEQLNEMLTEDMFKDMYESENREKFAEDMLVPLFEKEIIKRPKMDEPTEEEMREILKNSLKDVVFIH